jgi:hypothetical protein
VGIGTSSPAQKLEVTDGNIQIQNSATASSANFVYPNGLTFRATNETGQDRGTIATIRPVIVGDDNRFGITFNTQTNSVTGVTEKMRITAAGNVGIGRTDPPVRLAVEGAIYTQQIGNLPNDTESLMIGEGSSGRVGMWYKKYDNNTTDIIFKTSTNASSGTPVERVRIQDGKVGINCNAPAFPLHVTGSAACNTTFTYFALNTGILNTSGNFAYGMFVNSRALCTDGWFVNSDERIKTNIRDISDDEALQDIRLIKPKVYNYIDSNKKGNETVYGFIAQDVSSVLPYAIGTTKQFIPDIYGLADVCSNLVTLRNSNFIFNDMSANVRFVLKEYPFETTIHSQFVSSNQLTVDSPFGVDCSEVFVYGREIDDFYTLDKTAIFTVNVAATQELDRQLQVAKGKISQLEDTLSNVITRLSALET